MIVDTISNLSRYFPDSPNMQKAVRFLQNTDLSALEPGRFQVDGENIKCIVIDRELWGQPDFWESHNRYIDLHAVVSGTEIVRYLSNACAYDCGPYREDSDSCVCRQELSGTQVHVAANHAAVLFPNELHQANCPHTAGERVKKVILKVLVDIPYL